MLFSFLLIGRLARKRLFAKSIATRPVRHYAAIALAALPQTEHHPRRIEQRDREYALAKSQWSFKTAVELSAALAARKVSAVELAEDAIARIERHDARINAICVRDFERGLTAARVADAELARGVKKPLLGLPVTVKESYNIAGLPTTWGNPAQKDFRPAEDALPISRIKDAGGVILGKTNVPLGLGDWQSYNEIYGTTNNPFDLGHTPGGSSGGSSAALAAGYGPLSIGSDIGGSLRVPAFHCGIYAHKPTFDLVAMRGHTPPPLPPLPLHARPQRDRTDGARCGRPVAVARRDGRARSARIRQGLQPLAAGARHTEMKNFRVLLLDTDPVMPTNKRGARRAGKAGRQSRQGRRQDRPAPVRSCLILPRIKPALYADADVVPRGLLYVRNLCRRDGRRGRITGRGTTASPPSACGGSRSATATG